MAEQPKRVDVVIDATCAEAEGTGQSTQVGEAVVGFFGRAFLAFLETLTDATKIEER